MDFEIRENRRGFHADVDGGYQMIQGLSEPPL